MFQTLLKDIGLFKKHPNSQIAITHTNGVLYNVKLFYTPSHLSFDKSYFGAAV